MTSFKFIDGEQIEKTAQEEVEFLNSQISLDEVKKAKIKEVEENKKEFIYSPVEYNGSIFINSEIAGSNLQAAYNFGTDPQDWLNINGAIISLSKAEMVDIIELMMVKRSSGYFQEALKIIEIMNCNSASEVNLIDINFI